MSTGKRAQIVRAAAGTGKTTKLTKLYLEYLNKYEVRDIVAITFTRKAAAELLERVSQVLWSLTDEDSRQKRDASRALGKDKALYTDAAPKDQNKIRRALAELGDAPVGTTDSFVSKLLTEFALDARLPIQDGDTVALDFPIAAPRLNTSDIYEDEARRLLATPGAELPEDIRKLLEIYSLKEVLAAVTAPLDDALARLEPAQYLAVYEALADQLLEAVDGGAERIRQLLVTTLGLIEEEAVVTLEGKLNGAGKNAAPAIAKWVFDTAEPCPKLELLICLGTLNAWVYPTLLSGLIDLSPGLEGELLIDYPLFVKIGGERLRLPLRTVSEKVAWAAGLDEESIAIIEQTRRTLHKYKGAVNRLAMGRCAEEGVLDYTDYLRAATRLCEEARDTFGHPLSTRFKALLVDEVQDSNPRQVAFYKAFLEMNDQLEASFVGDTRQSIYLFNGADPTGMDDLSSQTWCDEGEPLNRNYRSSVRLVQAQRALFGGALTEVARSYLLNGLETINECTLNPGRNNQGENTVVRIVVPPDVGASLNQTQTNEAALALFAKQLIDTWDKQTEDHAHTAAVLCPQWSSARKAANILNALFQDTADGRYRAFVDKGGEWQSSRVVQDICILIAAFLDRSNQTAWLGLWKLPMVGLSDRALALISLGQGIDEDNKWQTHLGWILEADTLSDDHEQVDRDAFAFAAPHLRRARDAMGIAPLTDVLEQLLDALGWREILATDPDDEALFALAQALEWIRDLEAEGMSAPEILEVLNGTTAAERPNLEIHRGQKHVSCTTIFQAKGLKWDHVCVMSPGKGPNQGGFGQGGSPVKTNTSKVSIDGRDFLLSPVRLDIEGEFGRKQTDPIGALQDAIKAHRFKEEALRLTYVAMTRAAETVTLGFKRPGSRDSGAPAILTKAWVENGRMETPTGDGTQVEKSWDCAWDGVQYLVVGEPPAIPYAHVLGSVTEASRPDIEDFKSPVLQTPSWQRRAPSSLHVALPQEDKAALVDRVLSKAQVWYGADQALPTPSVHGLDELAEHEWGTIVHGWFERWGFDGRFTENMAREYLDQRWLLGEDDLPRRDAIAEWLVRLTDRLVKQTDSPLLNLVQNSKNRVFELPMVGVAEFGERSERPYLLSGKADLLVQGADGNWTLIDFKAGRHSPKQSRTTPAQLKADANLSLYVPQLEGYARAVNRAFQSDPRRGAQRVTQAMIWFVRTGTELEWTIQ